MSGIGARDAGSPTPGHAAPTWQVAAAAGLTAGALSLTPSMFPRTPKTQAIVSGISIAGGLVAGAAADDIVDLLDGALPGDRAPVQLGLIGAGVGATLLERGARNVAGRPIAGLALARTAATLLAVGAGAGLALDALSGPPDEKGERHHDDQLPLGLGLATLGGVAAFGTAAFLTWKHARPLPTLTTSVEKIAGEWIPRSTLDEKGLRFLNGALTDAPRVYGGVKSAANAQERALRIVNELEDQGAFQLDRIVVSQPTGSGWVDDIMLEATELLLPRTAFAASQYSTGSSIGSLLKGPEAADSLEYLLLALKDRKQLLFPKGGGPEVMLYGNSLGAGILADMVARRGSGAAGLDALGISRVLLTGRPGSSTQLAERMQGGAGRVFTSFDDLRAVTPDEAAQLRVIEFNNLDDTITNFRRRVAFESPTWLDRPRPGEVSTRQLWIPGVTWAQTAADIPQSIPTAWRTGHYDVPVVHDYRPFNADLVARAFGPGANSQAQIDDVAAQVRLHWKDYVNV